MHHLFMDTETHNAGTQWGKTPREFVRLFQYAWDWGPVQTTTDYDEMISLIESADMVVAHNGHAFDWSTLYGADSIRPLELAQEGRLLDTMILAHLVAPVPYSYTNRAGHTYYDAGKPAQAMTYYSLDNLCFQFGLDGKVGNLQDLAKKYNPPKTKVRDLDYGLIPLDDPEFMAYAVQDVEALRELYAALVEVQRGVGYSREYLFREQEIAAVNAQIGRNGIRIDTDSAQERVDFQAKQRDELLAWLVENYDFPTEGKQPWKSNAGKDAVLRVLESYSITFDDNPAWTATAKGAPSFSGDTMLAITEGTEAEELGQTLAILQGQRSMAALALESTYADGRAHPDTTMFQRSGRFSVSRPAITIWDNDNKDLFLADEGHVCVELDFSNADARAVAAMSGDKNFALRFEADEDGNAKYDGHNLTGEAFFGAELYYSQLDDHGKPILRPAAKAGGHALNYNIGPNKLAVTLNAAMKGQDGVAFWSPAWDEVDPKPPGPEYINTREMIANFNDQYPHSSPSATTRSFQRLI